MRSLEIFSGAGGLAKGLELAGFEHAAFVEFNKHACASLAVNFGADKVFFGDIRDFDLDSVSAVDIVAGGPPCQPFSLGGKHKADEDSRDMFPYAIQAIKKLCPKAFVFENVKGLLRPSFAEYFSYIKLCLTYPEHIAGNPADWQRHLSQLRKINQREYPGICYNVQFKLLNAADFGVPQTRERVVIVGIRSDINQEWKFPEQTHSEDSLLWQQHVNGEYWARHQIKPLSIDSVDSAQRIERLIQLEQQYGLFPPTLKPWRTVRDALNDLPNPETSHGLVDHVFKGGARSYPGHTGSDYDWPAKTIKAGGHGVPGGENMIRFPDASIRYFTVLEAKRIQTFPDDFTIQGAWGEAMRQIGNAVPVQLAEIIGKRLAQTLVGNMHGSLDTHQFVAGTVPISCMSDRVKLQDLAEAA